MRTHLLEMKYEFLKTWRMPDFTLPTLLFPVAFYMFFGVLLGVKSVGKLTLAEYLLATYGAFGVIGAALFGFGVSVATERGQGWLEAKRTTPMPISAYFLSKLVLAAIFGTIIVILLITLGTLFGNVVMPLSQSLALLGVLVAGSIPFCAIGLAIGFLAGPSSATPIMNIIYLPLGALSGLWIPIEFLPRNLQVAALWMPPYHYGQLALHVTGGSRGDSILFHVGALVVTTLLAGTIAWVGYRREE